MAARQSLRVIVEKWLGSTREQTIRVLAVHRSRSGRILSVCVEAQGATGPRTLFFFCHADRGWQVFPPDGMRPAMNLERLAA